LVNFHEAVLQTEARATPLIGLEFRADFPGVVVFNSGRGEGGLWCVGREPKKMAFFAVKTIRRRSGIFIFAWGPCGDPGIQKILATGIDASGAGCFQNALVLDGAGPEMGTLRGCWLRANDSSGLGAVVLGRKTVSCGLRGGARKLFFGKAGICWLSVGGENSKGKAGLRR